MAQTSREVAAAIPNAQLAIIPGAGHSPHLENPRSLAEVLMGFLRQVETRV